MTCPYCCAGQMTLVPRFGYVCERNRPAETLLYRESDVPLGSVARDMLESHGKYVRVVAVTGQAPVLARRLEGDELTVRCGVTVGAVVPPRGIRGWGRLGRP